MTHTEFIFDPDNTVEQRHGYYMFFGSIITFGILNTIVSAIGPPKCVKGDAWRWNNLFISWIHGAICGLWDILWYVIDYFTQCTHFEGKFSWCE